MFNVHEYINEYDISMNSCACTIRTVFTSLLNITSILSKISIVLQGDSVKH